MRPSATIFANRQQAGAALARAVVALKLRPPVVVLGLPRGGVPVAYEVARALDAPLDVLVVRKVGAPGQPELAIGALASGGVTVSEGAAAQYWADLPLSFRRLAEAEGVELARREQAYREGLRPLHFGNETVVLVDDGLATGCTMLAAVRAARKAGASKVVVAAPVSSREAAAMVSAEADTTVILHQPARLFSVGEWYEDFGQVGDAVVCTLLRKSRASDTRPRQTEGEEPMSTAILVADESEARFYEYERGTDDGPRLIRTLTDQQARKHDRDLASDRPGRVFDHAASPGQRRGAVGHHGTGGERSPRKEAAGAFAKHVAQELAAMSRRGACDRLVVIAGPPFLGTLRGELDDTLRSRVVAEVKRDLIHSPEADVLHAVAQSVGADAVR